MATADLQTLRDPLPLAKDLIRCPSITPADAGALGVLQTALSQLGFTCHRLPFGDVDNLYARLGTKAPVFCYAGHTDVVPVGDRDGWSVDPFEARVEDGLLIGRGASDMKSSIAAFVAATARFLDATDLAEKGSIALLITGDEEGVATNGTVKVLEWMDAQGEKLDHCLVGEPTNPLEFGEMVKIGRRGSINGVLTVHGTQGHVAYPHLADNPVPRLLATLTALTSTKLDDGTPHFQPSNLEVTSIDIGNQATNVIPASATARVNIRFNDIHTPASLEKWMRDICQQHAGHHELTCAASGEAFHTEPGMFTDLISASIKKVTGRTPELSTTGGTSDARFIKNHCAVAEFGLVGKTMHKIDEQCRLDDMEALTEVYREILSGYFS